ncbi:hypothetical protein EDB83DRAFT_2210365, partial [Lactarius deliciosus]
LLSSSHGRVSGKPWKSQKTATAYVLQTFFPHINYRSHFSRSHLPRALKSKSFSDRMAKASKAMAIRKLQAELKEEKEAEIQRRRGVTLERRKAA